MYAQVILFQKTGLSEDVLTYGVPSSIKNIHPGALVDVPLRAKIVRGVVLRVMKEKSIQAKTRDIEAIIHTHILPTWKLDLLNWLAITYHSPKSSIIKQMIPPYFREKKGEASEMLAKLVSSLEKKRPSKKIHTPKTQLHLVQNHHELLTQLKNTINRYPQGQVLIIAPEIAIPPFWTKMLEETYHAINYNAAKTPKQRAIVWKEVFEGKHHVIYGSRSTLLSPCQNLKAIIVLNEYNIGHKEDQRPKYHSRDLAFEIQKLSNSDLIFMGPSISLPLWQQTASNTHPLLERRSDTQFRIVDMKNERKRGNFTPISEDLIKILSATLEHKSQAIIFLNKRGESSCLLCRDCGYIPKCPICSRNLIVQRHTQHGYALTCIAGEVIEPVPEACPRCGSIGLRMVGIGQEKLISHLEKIFPEARMEIYSKERAKTPKEQADILKRFSKQSIDILITTQLLYSGAPTPQVPVVAALDIDTGLIIPHFMSGEKTLHHLQEMQTFLKPKGILLLQTHIPDNPLLAHYRENRLDEWCTKELSSRKRFNYPPFSKIMVLTSTIRDESARSSQAKKTAKQSLENTRKYIKMTEPDLSVELNKKNIGHKDKYYLIIRGKDPEKAMGVIRNMPDVSLDIDSPYLI